MMHYVKGGCPCDFCKRIIARLIAAHLRTIHPSERRVVIREALALANGEIMTETEAGIEAAPK